jgi:hypothetical protein
MRRRGAESAEVTQRRPICFSHEGHEEEEEEEEVQDLALALD